MRRPPAEPLLEWSDLLPSPGRVGWSSLPGSQDIRFTYSGRAAIHQYLAHLRDRVRGTGRGVVLVPAYHCPSVVDPIVHAGFDVRFYAVDEAVHIVAEDFLRKLDGHVAAALFIRYFGIARPDDVLMRACREAGVRIIDDSCHSFLEGPPVRLAHAGADATTYSFWKLLPTVVGGGMMLDAHGERPQFLPHSRPALRDSWKRLRTLGHHVRERYLPSDTRGETPTPAIRRPADEAYPYDAEASRWRLPVSARVILRQADLHFVLEKRRRNYELLASHLDGSHELAPLWRQLPASSCPYGFPVILRQRPQRDFLLRARGVPVFTFGEVLHPLLFARHAGEPRMLDLAKYLSDSVLCLAIHQRLTEPAILRIAGIVNHFLAELPASGSGSVVEAPPSLDRR